jgi:hypothetical protein
MPEQKGQQLNKELEKGVKKKSTASLEDSEIEKKTAKKMVGINNFFNTYFKFIILFVVLIIFFVSYVYILKPKYDEAIEAVKGNIINQERIYLQQLNKLNNYKQLVSSYNKISEDEKDKLNNLLPPDYIKEQLFIELGYIIPQKGHNLNYLNFKKDSEIEAEQQGQRRINNQAKEKSANSFLDDLPPDIGYIEAELKLSNTSYNGIRNLLKLLENNLRLIDVYKMKFDPAGEIFQVSFVTYYLKDTK